MFTFHKRGKVSAAEFLEFLPSTLPGEKIEPAKFKFSPHADAATLYSKLPANLREAALLLHPHCGPGTHLLYGADRVQLSWAPGAAGPDAAALHAAYGAALRRVVASCAPAPAAHAAAAPLEVLLDWVSPAESKAWARTVGQNGGSQLKEFKRLWGAEVAPAREPGKLRVVGSRAAVDAAVEGLIKWRDDVLAPFYNPSLSKLIRDVCVATAPCPAQAQALAQAQATPYAPNGLCFYSNPRTPIRSTRFYLIAGTARNGGAVRGTVKHQLQEKFRVHIVFNKPRGEIRVNAMTEEEAVAAVDEICKLLLGPLSVDESDM